MVKELKLIDGDNQHSPKTPLNDPKSAFQVPTAADLQVKYRTIIKARFKQNTGVDKIYIVNPDGTVDFI